MNEIEVNKEIGLEPQKQVVDMPSTGIVSTMLSTGGTEIKKKRVSVYLRVSDRKSELDRQKHAIKEWIENNKMYDLQEVYLETKSARGGVYRKQLNRMIKDGEAHKYDIAVFWSVDRFGRNVRDGLARIEHFWNHGIDVYIASLNQFWDKNDMQGKMMLQIMLVFAEFESDMIRSRAIEGMKAKNAKLDAYGEMHGIEGLRIGTPSILESWIKDPYARAHKRGWSVCRDRDKEELFKAIWNNPAISSAYSEIEELIRIPAIPNCMNKCHQWNDDGTIINKPDDAYRKQKCLCNKKPSRKAIHKARTKLGLEPRNPHSFKRKDTFSSWDALEMDSETKEGIKGDSK